MENRALLSDTVITFDDLPAGTHEVSDQYQAEGVVFTGTSLPSVVTAPAGQAQSGTHVASIRRFGGEFVTPQVSGTFTNLHQHVKVYVGEFEENVSKSAQLTIRAYDASHNLIAESNPVTVYSGAGFHTPLEVDSPTPNIASFEVTGRKPVSGDVGDLDKRVAIDDLTFDNPTIDVSAAQQHTLDVINQYRAQANAPALKLDAALNNFAYAASQDLMNTHIPHNYINTHGNPYWETQGYWYGVPIVGWPDAPDLNATIDQILGQMMAEPFPPPGGFNHHSIIIDPAHTQLGVGLIVDSVNGTLYFTSDFTP